MQPHIYVLQENYVYCVWLSIIVAVPQYYLQRPLERKTHNRLFKHLHIIIQL